MLVPEKVSERAAFLDELGGRLLPSADFFIFTLLAGVALGVAMVLDSPALYVLAALLAPFMAPVLGLSLAAVVGSMRFFFQSLGGIVMGAFIIFLEGCLAGLFVLIWPQLEFQQAVLYGHFSWPDLIVLTAGAALTVYLLLRSPQNRPLVASVALAYELYLPAGVAGFGLVSGIPHLFPDGLLVFAVHLSFAVLVGAIMLAILGMRPLNVLGYTIGTTMLLVGVAAVVALSGLGTAVGTKVGLPPPTATVSPTVTLTRTQTMTPPPPSATASATNTLVPSQTHTLTVSPVPTPVWARIASPQGGGANVRAEPSPEARVITILSNGILVEVLPEVVKVGNTTYAHIRTAEGVEGWIVSSLLATATPVAGW